MSEQGRERKVKEDNALLSFLLLEPGGDPALADYTMQINAADNVSLLPEHAKLAAARARSLPRGNVCCVVKTLAVVDAHLLTTEEC